MGRPVVSRLQKKSLVLGISMIPLLSFFPAWSQSTAGGKTDALDPALRSIVRKILEQPNEDEVVIRAGQWSRAKNRSRELLEAVLAQARQQQTDELYHFCARFLLQEGDPLRAISVLEEGCSIPGSSRCPHALGRIFLQGGWVEAVQSIRKTHGVDIWTGILLQMLSGKDFNRETFPEIDSHDREYLIQTLSRLNLCQEGAVLFESAEDPQAALSILIRGGDLPGIEDLLSREPGLIQNISSEEILPLARLQGRLPDNLFIPRTVVAKWKSSMGFEKARSDSIMQNAAESRLFQSLTVACKNGDTPLARKIWISIEMLLPPLQAYPALNSRWEEILRPALAPWTNPQAVADKMGSVNEPKAATLCRRAMLYSEPGSQTEARLWFHAGRLSSRVSEVERAQRILPDGFFRWPTPVTGISVTARLGRADLPLSWPNPISLRPSTDSILGEIDGVPLRTPEMEFSTEEWILTEWRMKPDFDKKSPASFLSPPGLTGKGEMELGFTDSEGLPVIIRGGVEKWSVRVDGEESKQLQASGEASLFDEGGLPRLDLLQQIIRPCPTQLGTQIDWDKWPTSLRQFAQACGRYLRNSEWARHTQVQKEDDQLSVKVGPITGTFIRQLPASKTTPADLSDIPSPRSLPETGDRSQNSRFPDSPAGFSATLIREKATNSAEVFTQFSPPVLLPAGEVLLSVSGTDHRLALTRSGKVGWLPAGSIVPQSWFPLLKTPLPGIDGLPPLPKEVHPPRFVWANPVTPRVRETRCADGSVFLILGDPLIRFDLAGSQPLPWPDSLSKECTSAQLLAADGKLPSSVSDPLFPWFIDQASQFLHGPGFQQLLPADGAYSLHGHPEGPLVIGQYQGETWLALWKEDRWNFLDLPPLPGERDRPYLRAASIEVIGHQILLVADRLWRLHPEDAPIALIPSPDPGAYRAVHWVQPPPQFKRDRVLIQRPWGMDQVWRFNDE